MRALLLAAICAIQLGAPLRGQDAKEARRLLEERRWAEAEEAFQAMQKRGDLSPEHLDDAVRASRELNHWGRVVELYSLFPLSAEQQVKLYEAYLRLGETEKARRQLENLLRKRPHDERLVHLLAFLHLSNGRPNHAARLYEEFLEEHPKAFESLVNAALIDFSLQRTEQALARLSAAYQAGGEEANRYFHRQLARNMENMGEQALAELARDVRLSLGLPDEGAGTHLHLAEEFRRLNRYAPAAEGYEKYLKAHPRDRNARLQLARVYFLQGKSPQARQVLRPLLEDPRGASHEARLFAAELAVKEDDFESARRHLEALPASYDSRPEVRYLKGRAALEAGDTEKALRLLEQVTRESPGIVEAFFHLGRLYMRLGRREEGRAMLSEFQRRK